MADWSYGDAWERYPIAPGTPWQETASASIVAVHDIFDGVPAFLRQATMIYADPPWTLSNVSGFYTKAGLPYRADSYEAFAGALESLVESIEARVCYLEIGAANLARTERILSWYPSVETWRITYYRKHPMFLVRGGAYPAGHDFTGIDDEQTPQRAIAIEKLAWAFPEPLCVADPFTGRGLTAVSAIREGVRFVGTELNPRRLACAIDKTTKWGAIWSPMLEGEG